MSKVGKGLPLLLIIIFALGMIGCGTQVSSGHRGVFYSKFGDGTQMGKIYSEGFTWHLPWNSMFVYKVQTQERKEVLNVLASDGATRAASRKTARISGLTAIISSGNE